MWTDCDVDSSPWFVTVRSPSSFCNRGVAIVNMIRFHPVGAMVPTHVISASMIIIQNLTAFVFRLEAPLGNHRWFREAWMIATPSWLRTVQKLVGALLFCFFGPGESDESFDSVEVKFTSLPGCHHSFLLLLLLLLLFSSSLFWNPMKSTIRIEAETIDRCVVSGCNKWWKSIDWWNEKQYKKW